MTWISQSEDLVFFFCAPLFDFSKFKCLNIKNHDPSIGLNQNLNMLFLFILMKLILRTKSVVLGPLRVNIIEAFFLCFHLKESIPH